MPPESPYRIEPCSLESIPPELGDLLAEIVAASTTLGSRLHPRSAESLAGLVRVMNCYYSNLIEGHDTRPRDIERALTTDFSHDPAQRDLQLEATAHIRVQAEIDHRHACGVLAEPTDGEFIRWMHGEFYRDAPDSMLTIEHPGGPYRMEPGVYRHDPRHDVVVGRHLPLSSTAVLRFMEYFSDHFRLGGLGRSQRIIAIAVAHHRFNYIHPFPDGNGRVSRLLSHAMALVTEVGAHGLWSISRGLARGLEDRGEYLVMMNNTDAERRGDTDGRGNLSLQALIEFIEWFCKVCLDQLQYMATLFDFERLRDRLSRYAIDELGLHPGSEALLETILRSGELPRSASARVIGTGERNARNVLSALTSAGLLASSTPKGPVALRFDSTSAESLFPRLFPAQVD